MKRFSWVVLAGLVFLTSSAFAQDITYGVIGGLGSSFFDGYDQNDGLVTKTAMGINLGVTGAYEYKDNIILRGTIAYSKYFPGSDSFDWGKFDYTVGDLSIELDANYYFNDKVYGIAGTGTHMLSYKIDYTYDPNYYWGWGGSGTYDWGTTNFGLHLGAGYKLNDKLAVEAKYILVSDIPQLKVSAVYYLGTYSF